MKTNQSDKTETNKQAAPAAPDAGKLSNEALLAKAEGEAKAFRDYVAECMKKAEGLGAIAMDFLAEEMGRKTGKTGRPDEEAFNAFTLAMTATRPTFNRRNELFRKANKAVPFGSKPVAVLSAKGTNTEGAQKYKLNRPAAVDIALGE